MKAKRLAGALFSRAPCSQLFRGKPFRHTPLTPYLSGCLAAQSQRRFCAASTFRELSAALDIDDEDFVRMCRRYPPLLQAKAPQVMRNLAFLEKNAGMRSKSALTSAARQCPQLLMADCEATLRPALDAIVALVPRIADDVVKNCPDALLSKPADMRRLKETLSAYGVPFEKLVNRTPRIIVQSPGSVAKVHAFLLDQTIGPAMDTTKAVKVMTKFPMLLVGTKNVSRQLAPLVAFLRTELGVDPASDDCIYLYAWPDALSTIKPNVSFLCSECGFTPTKLREHVALLAYSFEQRLFPRVMWIKRNDFEIPSLWTLLEADDRKFSQVVGPNYDAYFSFFRELRKTGAASAWVQANVKSE